MMTSVGCDLFEICYYFILFFCYFWQDVVFENWMFTDITRSKREMLQIFTLTLIKKKEKKSVYILSDISIGLLLKQIKVFLVLFFYSNALKSEIAC